MPPSRDDVKAGFSVTAEGVERRLLTVVEKPSGDLYIFQVGGKNYHDDLINPPIGAYVQRRISVHASPNSPNGNLIKLTFSNDRGVESITTHFTRAIKSNDKYAPILHCRLADPRAPEFNPPSSGDYYKNIGEFDPSAKMFLYSIAVAPAEKEYKISNFAPGWHVDRINFNAFSLFIFWQVVDMPSHRKGETAAILTMKDNSSLSLRQKIWMSKMMGGYEDREIALHSLHFQLVLISRFIFFMERSEGMWPELSDAIRQRVLSSPPASLFYRELPKALAPDYSLIKGGDSKG